MPRFKISVDPTWKYRWRLIARDGTALAESTTSYREKDACIAAIGMVKQVAAIARVEGVTQEEAPRPGSELGAQ